jgi:hypothetical protein
MTTFTIRVSNSLAPRLNSAQMRAWIEEFLRQPHPLPGDPGSGPVRMSLTLPGDSVRAVADHLGCSASEALRRLVAEALGPSARAAAPKSRGLDLPRWIPREARIRGESSKPSLEMTPEAVNTLLGLIASVVMFGVSLLVWYFIRYRSGKIKGN